MATNDSIPNTIEIPLTRGYTAIVDMIDGDLIASKWQARINPKSRTVYAQRACRRNSRKAIDKMHRVIMGRVTGKELTSKEEVDHIDGNGLNNCRSNLRITTHRQNKQNSRKPITNTSGFKGVSWDKSAEKWSARIDADGRGHFLGFFDDATLAHEAYKKAAVEYFGEFARFE